MIERPPEIEMIKTAYREQRAGIINIPLKLLEAYDYALDLESRLQQAEADNANLLDWMKTFHEDCSEWDAGNRDPEEVLCDMQKALEELIINVPHPGDVILEELEQLRVQTQDTRELKLKLLKYMRAFKMACKGGGDWCKGCEHDAPTIDCSVCREKYYLENANPPRVEIIDPVKMWQPENAQAKEAKPCI